MKVVCGRPHVIMSSNAQKKVRKNSYLRFAEKLNGRCAMQGTLWSMGSALTGNHQFDALYFTLVTGAVALGTAITFDDDDVAPPEAFKNFTPEAELDNGRLAMIGMGGYFASKALETLI